MKCGHMCMFIRQSAVILKYLQNRHRITRTVYSLCELPVMLWATERHGRMVERLLRVRNVDNVRRAS